MKTTEQTPAVQNLISAAAQAGEQFTDDGPIDCDHEHDTAQEAIAKAGGDK